LFSLFGNVHVKLDQKGIISNFDILLECSIIIQLLIKDSLVATWKTYKWKSFYNSLLLKTYWCTF